MHRAGWHPAVFAAATPTAAAPDFPATATAPEAALQTPTAAAEAATAAATAAATTAAPPAGPTAAAAVGYRSSSC